MVTNYGGQSYGWYQYGPSAQMAFLIDSVVTAPVVVTTPVPEPGTLAMLIAGLGLLGFAARHRRPSQLNIVRTRVVER